MNYVSGRKLLQLLLRPQQLTVKRPPGEVSKQALTSADKLLVSSGVSDIRYPLSTNPKLSRGAYLHVSAVHGCMNAAEVKGPTTSSLPFCGRKVRRTHHNGKSREKYQ